MESVTSAGLNDTSEPPVNIKGQRALITSVSELARPLTQAARDMSNSGNNTHLEGNYVA